MPKQTGICTIVDKPVVLRPRGDEHEGKPDADRDEEQHDISADAHVLVHALSRRRHAEVSERKLQRRLFQPFVFTTHSLADCTLQAPAYNNQVQ